jgi:hypothetical protein
MGRRLGGEGEFEGIRGTKPVMVEESWRVVTGLPCVNNANDNEYQLQVFVLDQVGKD